MQRRLSVWSGIKAASGAVIVRRWKPPAVARRGGPWPYRGLWLAIVLLGLPVAMDVARGLGGLEPCSPLPIVWFSWAVLAAAAGMAHRRGRSPAALHAAAALGLGLVWLERGHRPGLFFLWSAASDLAAFALLAALIGWAGPRLTARGKRSALDPPRPFLEPRRASWFCLVQAIWIAGTAVLAGWIALDFRFEGLGQHVALFGLAGRSAGAAIALMLLGATILMAWQTRGRWRAGWQYAALAAGVLLTSSFGWSQLDISDSAAVVWLQRSERLLASAAMMTLMTGLGLARILPRGSDWVPRARRAMPLFAGLALLMLGLVLLQRFYLGALPPD